MTEKNNINNLLQNIMNDFFTQEELIKEAIRNEPEPFSFPELQVKGKDENAAKPEPKPEKEDKTETQKPAENNSGEKPASSADTAKKQEADVQEEEDPRTLEELLEELDGLVGLEKVKEDVHSLMNFIKIALMRKDRDMQVPTMSYHLVFTGNPGTGKTTIARLLGKLYKKIGLLEKGQLIETDRSGLVAGYMGQTAIKTQEVIQKALGGILFIDEAYSLTEDEKDSFGREAVETVLKAMEDHRDELVVIVAGYTDLMHKFIDSNPGLSSRFNKYFEFPDYTGEELMKIFERFCKTNGYVLADDAAEYMQNLFNEMYEQREANFGNARDARNLFETIIAKQADRLAALSDEYEKEAESLDSRGISDKELQTITMQDCEF